MDITRRASASSGEAWPDHARHQCKRWLEHATQFRWAFYDEQMRKKRVYAIMKYGQGVLLALTPTTSFADWLSAFSDSTRLTVCGIIGTLALLIKFMINASALEAYIGKCEHAIREYDNIINDINNQLLTRTQEDWEDLFIRVTRKFTEVSASSPALPFNVLIAQGIVDRDGKPMTSMFVSVTEECTPVHGTASPSLPMPPSVQMDTRPPSPTVATTIHEDVVMPSPIPRAKGNGTPQRTSAILKRVQSISGLSSIYGSMPVAAAAATSAGAPPTPARAGSNGSTGTTLRAAYNRLEAMADTAQNKLQRRAMQRQQAHMATRMPLLNVLVENNTTQQPIATARRIKPGGQSWHIPLPQTGSTAALSPPPDLAVVDVSPTVSATTLPPPPQLNLQMPLSHMIGQPLQPAKKM